MGQATASTHRVPSMSASRRFETSLICLKCAITGHSPMASRPWSPFSEVARLLQTGRTIEDPYDRLVWIAVVRNRAY